MSENNEFDPTSTFAPSVETKVEAPTEDQDSNNLDVTVDETTQALTELREQDLGGKDVKAEELSVLPRFDKPTGQEGTANTEVVAIPSVILQEFTKTLSRFTEVFEDKDPSRKDWLNNIAESVEFHTKGGFLQPQLDDQNASWEQGVRNKDDVLLTTHSVPFKTGGDLKGEIALLKVSKALGIGDVTNVILPHSGIWLTIKPPTERALIDFYNSVFREKVMFGKATSGLAFSNYSAWMNLRLYEFILKHVHAINYSDIPREHLDNYILIHDFEFLVHGFAKAMYPNGFDHARACVAEPTACNHISTQKLILESLELVNNKALSDIQRNLLHSCRPNSLNLESYRTYTSQHSVVVKGSHTLANGIKFNFKIPTLREYTTDGIGWINGISSIVENVLTDSTDENIDREEVLMGYIRSTVLRQFGHFVDSIELNDEEVITDRDTITSTLELFSADDDIRIELTRAIVEYKAKTTIGIIAIEEYKCPNCNQVQPGSTEYPVFSRAIPLDSVNLFFLMLTSKISKILEREI